jgi:hypothetical protein
VLHKVSQEDQISQIDPQRRRDYSNRVSFLTDMTQGFLTNMTHPPRPVRV